MIGLARQALAVLARTKMGAEDILEAPDPFPLRHGSPNYIRSDNGPRVRSKGDTDQASTRWDQADPDLSGVTQGERVQRAVQWEIAARGSQCGMVHVDQASPECYQSLA